MGVLTDRDGGPLDSFLRSLPGYAGYVNKERRRDADKVLRTYLAGRVGELVRSMQRMQRDLAARGELSKLPPIERVLQRMQHVADRLTTATYGYAPLFDNAPIREEELDQLYAFDSALSGYVDGLQAAVAGLERAVSEGTDPQPAAMDVVKAVGELDRQIDRRTDLITKRRLLTVPELSELLAARPKAVSTAAQLLSANPGDAVSVEGLDYVVKAKISYQSAADIASLWIFDGTQHFWLEVLAKGGMLGFGPEEPAPFPANAPDVYTVGGVEFRLLGRENTIASVRSESGEAGGLAVERLKYAAGDKILLVERWRQELKVKVLRIVDPGFVQVWPRK